MTTTVSTRKMIVTDGAKRDDERTTMGPELARIADRWDKEENQLDKSELEIRYRWAKDVKLVMERRDLYGDDAAVKLFAVRMTSDNNIGSYHNVSTYIDESFYNDVVAFNAAKTARKGHITWSHLVYFGRIGVRESRQRLLEQCMKERWSVATLREKVTEAIMGGDAEPTTELRQASAGSIAKRVTRSAVKLEKDCLKLLCDEFDESIITIRSDARDETVKQITEARDAVAVCRDLLQASMVRLEGACLTLSGDKRAVSKTDTPPNATSPTLAPPAKPVSTQSSAAPKSKTKKRFKKRSFVANSEVMQ